MPVTKPTTAIQKLNNKLPIIILQSAHLEVLQNVGTFYPVQEAYYARQWVRMGTIK